MMSDLPLLHGMGPPPFRFQPAAGASAAPAFSITFKILATLIALACAAAFMQAWLLGRFAGTARAGGWFLAGLALVLVTWVYMLRSRTWLDARGLHQSWVWDKHMDFDDLAYCKLIRVRGLDWLIAPRLYARTLMGKFSVFYASSPAMVSEFERLIAELKAFRKLR
jgi:uncharacterized membrane protein (DUF485 family)